MTTSLHHLIDLHALQIKLSDPRYSYDARVASLDHALSAAMSDGQLARADELVAMRHAFAINAGGANHN